MQRKNMESEKLFFEALRQKAEKKLAKRQLVETANLTEADTLKLIHELDVYHLELEMQNDELIEAKKHAKIAFEKYTSFYEFAHTGYFSVLFNGKICELNITAAKMLGRETSTVINRRLSEFITLYFMVDYNQFIKNVFASDFGATSEVRIKSKGNPSVFVRLEGRASQDGQKCLVVVVDETKRKRIEEVLDLELLENDQYHNLLKISDQHIHDLKKEINQLMLKLKEKEEA